MKNPEECATYLTAIFGQLSADLSDHHTGALEEEYFRMRTAREEKSVNKKKTQSLPKQGSVALLHS